MSFTLSVFLLPFFKSEKQHASVKLIHCWLFFLPLTSRPNWLAHCLKMNFPLSDVINSGVSPKTHMHTHTHKHTNTQIHTYTHTHTHTNAYTHTRQVWEHLNALTAWRRAGPYKHAEGPLLLQASLLFLWATLRQHWVFYQLVKADSILVMSL